MASSPRRNKKHPRFDLVGEIVVAISVVIIASVIGIETIPRIVTTGTDSLAAVISTTLVDLTNIDRAGASQHRLTISPLLMQAAQAKADDMAARGYFAHVSPEGVTPWHWLSASGYDFYSAGENLAIDFFDSAEVEKAWMNSPAHRANIVNGTFTEIGIATARGMYNGHETTFVVQMFGRPVTNSSTISSPDSLTILASTTDFVAASRE